MSLRLRKLCSWYSTGASGDRFVTSSCEVSKSISRSLMLRASVRLRLAWIRPMFRSVSPNDAATHLFFYPIRKQK